MSGDCVLVTGATGLLGPYICAEFSDCNVITTARRNADYNCDLTDAQAVEKLIRSVKPDTVIHLMALTDVDYCEANQDTARLFNATSVEQIVAALDPEAALIYLSSDQVYRGDDGPHPVSYTHLTLPTKA